ncbi:MAG: tubulin/FtsZ family protein [Methanomicrobium sp.]|nr:tubulin/FtsZ family protein [Methanomicrobium sp.]MDD4299131.1 tubulin/FtsZ family protein [Methanomicrobium sp.]
MRILAIGVGGAGSRIVDQLYYQDRRSSVSCISSVVVDTDGNFLSQLKNLPDETKIFFPALDPDVHYDIRSTIDVSEVMGSIKRMDNIDIDAIIVFVGLGGNVSDIVPELIKEIRKAYFEPVFALCTLPYLREGRAIAKKAADDLDKIRESVDAVILFDNETWYRKIKASFETTLDEHGEPVVKPSPYGKSFSDNPRDVYRMLNERISRQIGLILRAGEFNESGFESAEVVLDAGEILNTLKGNGITAIGYAIENLPFNWMDTLERWRSDTYFSEGSHKRATRIVALAKQAVYEDISIPCDLTSADKALILIAGPSHELSMKGFQTVRKWIDSSIAGLEMRSGDYPVKNTRFVGIIIMLSGLHNIPRLEEIKKLREEYLLEQAEIEKSNEYSRILEEEEALLLSGRGNFEQKPPVASAGQENIHVDYMPEYYEVASLEHQEYPEYSAYPKKNSVSSAGSYDEKAIEDEAWGLIGGYSSVPPKNITVNSNIPPIIEDNGYHMNRQNDNSHQNYDGGKRTGQNEPVKSAGSLDIVDFLEDESTGFESDVSAAFDNFGDNSNGRNSMSFVELLDDDDSCDFGDENEAGQNYGSARKATFSEAAFSYLADDDEDENIPLTSPEFVKKQEIEEYKQEAAESKAQIPKEKIQDDKITIAGKKEKVSDNSGLNLPGRSSKTDLDMTRMTSVNLGNSPRDSIFGVKEIKGPGVPKERSDVARVGETISIGGPVQRASDKSFSAGAFSAGSTMRPNDNVYAGGKISGGSVIRPNDSSLSGRRVSIQPNIKSNDRSLSGGRLSVHPNIKPKDNLTGGKVSMGSSAKKPVELLSSGIKSDGIVKPKELLSGGVKTGSVIKPKESLTGGVRVGSNPAMPKESLSGVLKVGKNPANKSSERKSPVSPNTARKKESSKSSFSSDKEDDLFWI